MRNTCAVLIVLFVSVGLAATNTASLKSEEYARVIYRNLFGIQAIKEKLLYPVQPQLDRVIAYTTAEAQVNEINGIIQESAERISADTALRDQLMYEYRAAFSEEELAEYSRWLESPLSKKIRRFELRNSFIYNPIEARHFRAEVPRLRELLDSAEESTKSKPYKGE